MTNPAGTDVQNLLINRPSQDGKNSDRAVELEDFSPRQSRSLKILVGALLDARRSEGLSAVRAAYDEAIAAGIDPGHPVILWADLQSAWLQEEVDVNSYLGNLIAHYKKFKDQRVLQHLAERLVSAGRASEALDLLGDAIDTADSEAAQFWWTKNYARIAIHSTSYEQARFSRPSKRPPATGCVMVMMLRDEQDIIGPQLEHHYLLGFRTFFLLDHASEDATPAIIEAFRRSHDDAVVIFISDRVPGYFQAERMKSLTELARWHTRALGLPCEWIFPLDADEFIDLRDDTRTLTDVCAEASAAKVLYLPWCNVAIANGQTSIGDDIYQAVEVVASFSHICKPKCAFVNMDHVSIVPGNHYVSYPNMRRTDIAIGSEFGIRLIHFPMRSYTQIEKKYKNGAQAYKLSSGGKKNGWTGRESEISADGLVGIERIFKNHFISTARNTRKRPFRIA